MTRPRPHIVGHLCPAVVQSLPTPWSANPERNSLGFAAFVGLAGPELHGGLCLGAPLRLHMGILMPLRDTSPWDPAIQWATPHWQYLTPGPCPNTVAPSPSDSECCPALVWGQGRRGERERARGGQETGACLPYEAAIPGSWACQAHGRKTLTLGSLGISWALWPHRPWTLGAAASPRVSSMWMS